MKSLTKKQWIAVSAALVVIILFFFSSSFITSFFTAGVTQTSDDSAMSSSDTEMQKDPAMEMKKDPINSPKTMTPPTLQITDTVIGTGATAVNGKTVTVHYTGKFQDGVIFDSSLTRGVPFEFVLGAGQVITGWESGLVGMKVGGKRMLVIPPDLGYGSENYGPIPGGSTLVFDIELLGVR